jgi:Dienelactone hydrolase and related enzymes
MTEVVLYHHVQGLTDGVRSFADELRQAGHTVHTPDLFDGRTFATVEEGLAFARDTGFQALVERGVAAAQAIPPESVYAGFSFGVMSAQRWRRPGRAPAAPCSCTHVCRSRSSGTRGPTAYPSRSTGRTPTPFLEDIEAAQALAASTDQAELFIYPGEQHLFADSSLPDYDSAAAALLTERVLAFLAAV